MLLLVKLNFRFVFHGAVNLLFCFGYINHEFKKK